MLDKVPELRAMTMVIRRHQRCMSARQLLVVNCADLSLLSCQTSGFAARCTDQRFDDARQVQHALIHDGTARLPTYSAALDALYPDFVKYVSEAETGKLWRSLAKGRVKRATSVEHEAEQEDVATSVTDAASGSADPWIEAMDKLCEDK